MEVVPQAGESRRKKKIVLLGNMSSHISYWNFSAKPINRIERIKVFTCPIFSHTQHESYHGSGKKGYICKKEKGKVIRYDNFPHSFSLLCTLVDISNSGRYNNKVDWNHQMGYYIWLCETLLIQQMHYSNVYICWHR